MSQQTRVEAEGLQDLVVKYFDCPRMMYSFFDVAKIMNRLATQYEITPIDIRDFRMKWFSDKRNMPVQLVAKPDISKSPATLEEMCTNAMIDTMGVRNGVMDMAFNILVEAKEKGDYKTALNSINTLLKGADAVDTKLKQLSPNSDPAGRLFMDAQFIKFKNILIEIDRQHPESKILHYYKQEVDRQAAVDEETFK